MRSEQGESLHRLGTNGEQLYLAIDVRNSRCAVGLAQISFAFWQSVLTQIAIICAAIGAPYGLPRFCVKRIVPPARYVCGTICSWASQLNLLRVKSMNAALATRLADRIADLGNIPLERICCDPSPGQATFEDLLRMQAVDGRLYEWVDQTLVEKAMGWQESMLAGVLLHWLHQYLDGNNLGLASGADGFSRLFLDTVRGPDVAFVNWARLPHGVPTEPIPDLVPNFVIEVLSQSNTRGELARKRREYFHAGVQLVWIVDLRARTVAVYRSADNAVIADCHQNLDTGDILPGFEVNLSELFARLDQTPPPVSELPTDASDMPAGSHAKQWAGLQPLRVLDIPKAVMVVSGTQDRLFPPLGQREAAHQIQAAFAWAGCPERFYNYAPDKPHCYDAEIQAEALAWFDKHLKPY